MLPRTVAAAVAAVLAFSAAPAVADDLLGDILVTAERVMPDGRFLDRRFGPATALALTNLQLPASTDVIDLRGSNERTARTLAEATRGLTGVTFTTRAGAPGVFSSRGFTENALVTLYDGVRVQSATITARNYDPFNFERIESLRGPASVTLGEGATAGAINYVRRKPRLGEMRTEALLEVGSYDRRRVAVAVDGGLSDTLGAVASASWQEYGTSVDAVEQRSLHAVAGVAGRIGDSAGFLVEADYLSTDADDAYWGQPLVAGRVDESIRERNYNLSPDNRMDDDVLWLTATATARVAAGIDWRGTLYRYDADRDWRNFYAFAYVGGAAPQAEVRNVEDLGYDHDLWGTRQVLDFNYAVGGRRAQTALIIEYSDTDFSSPRRDGAPAGGAPRPRFDLFAPQPVAFGPLTGPRLRQREAAVEQAAVGLEQRLDVAAGWTLIAGVRGTWIDATLARPQATPPVAPFDVSPSPVDWRLAATWSPTQDQSVYAAYTSGSEPVESLLLLPLSQANFDLTRAEGVELGWKRRWLGGALETQSAVYWLEKDRLPSINPADPGLPPQVGRQTSQGVELGAVYAADRWRWSANVAYTDAEFDQFNDFGAFRDGVRPANVPEWVANANASYRVLAPLRVGGLAQYVSSRPSNNANVLFVDAYTVVDLFAEWQATPRLTVTARIANALDESYVEWATQTFGQNNLYFGNGRRYELSLGARF
jgi:iron complex outermembrane receptor protein